MEKSKVTPLQEAPEEETEMILKGDDEITPITISNEDLQKLYKEKKELKNKKEVHHFENAHRNLIRSLAVTSDNEYIISGAWDGTIKVFRLSTKELHHDFGKVHGREVLSVGVTSDSRYIISSSGDCSIKVFDLSTKELHHDFGRVHERFIESVSLSPDNKYILSGSGDWSMKVFDLSTKELFRHFENIHKDTVVSMTMTSDSKYIITGSSDGTIKVLDLISKQEIHHFKNAHSANDVVVALTSDDKYIISGSSDRCIKIFDLTSYQEIHQIKEAHSNRVASLALTSDNRYFISGSYDRSIKVFDLSTKQEIHHFENAHKGEISSLKLTSDNKYIISASSDKSIKVFNLIPERQIHHFKNVHNDYVSSVAVTPDNKYIISGSNDHSIKVFDFNTGKVVSHIEYAHRSNVSTVAVTPDNKYIISGSRDWSVGVFDLETGQRVKFHDQIHECGVHSVAITPDNKYFISGSEDKSIKVFDLSTQEEVYTFVNAHEGKGGSCLHITAIKSVAVTSDSKYLISGSNDRSIKIFELSTKEEIYHFENVHEDGISSVAVTADSKYIISASWDKSIKVFDWSTKQEVHHFKNIHHGDISSVAITSDNKYIISGSSDRSLKVFDFRTKQEIHHFENAHEGGVTSITLTSDNKYVISGSHDRSVKVFDLTTKQENPQILSPENSKKKDDQASSSRPNPSILDEEELFFISGERKELSPFTSFDSFLFGKPVEYSISVAEKFPGMFVLPFRWNILHIVTVFAKDDFIERMPNFSQFKMPFLLDAFDRTPFHYLIAHKKVNLMTVNALFGYICDYLEDCRKTNPFEFQKIINSLSPLLPEIFEKIQTKPKQKFLALVYTGSSLPYNVKAPDFGEISSKSTFCDSPVLTKETCEKICEKKETIQVEFRSYYLHLDYDILSEDMTKMVASLKMETSQNIFKVPAIATMIDQLWEQAKTPLRIFFALYSIFIIALSVYLTLNDRCLPYEIVLLAMSVSLTGNELWQIYNLKKSYLKNPWNLLDLAHLLFTIAFLGTRITANHEDELARAWMSTIIVILGYVRWISLLKIFKPTRSLIQVVLTIVKDMISFIIVIALIILGFSLIFLVFNREAGYGDYLYEAYNVMYGPMDINEDAAWPFSQKLLMATLAFFLNVVLLNLLISIMGESYDDVKEMRVKTDALTRLEMISEATIYRKLVQFNHQTKRGHLIYCLPVELEEDESEQNLDTETFLKTQQKNEEQQTLMAVRMLKMEEGMMKMEKEMLRKQYLTNFLY